MTDRTYLGQFEQIVLLAVIHLEGDGYGVSVRREIASRTGRDVSIGSVYATLDRLETKGFLESREGEASPVRGGRARRHFTARPEGLEALGRTRSMMDEMWRGASLDRGTGPA